MDETAETIERGAPDFTELTTSLVAAYVSNNHVQPSEIGCADRQHARCAHGAWQCRRAGRSCR